MSMFMCKSENQIPMSPICLIILFAFLGECLGSLKEQILPINPQTFPDDKPAVDFIISPNCSIFDNADLSRYYINDNEASPFYKYNFGTDVNNVLNQTNIQVLSNPNYHTDMQKCKLKVRLTKCLAENGFIKIALEVTKKDGDVQLFVANISVKEVKDIVTLNIRSEDLVATSKNTRNDSAVIIKSNSALIEVECELETYQVFSNITILANNQRVLKNHINGNQCPAKVTSSIRTDFKHDGLHQVDCLVNGEKRSFNVDIVNMASKKGTALYQRISFILIILFGIVIILIIIASVLVILYLIRRRDRKKQKHVNGFSLSGSERSSDHGSIASSEYSAKCVNENDQLLPNTGTADDPNQPGTPVKHYVDHKQITLKWEAPPACKKDKTLFEYILERCDIKDMKWEPLVKDPQKETTFTDKTLSKTIKYKYCVTAIVDDIRSASKHSEPLMLLSRDSEENYKPRSVDVRYDIGEKAVILEWEPPLFGGVVDKYTVERRSKRDPKYTTMKLPIEKSTKFVDKEIDDNQEYLYSVGATLKDLDAYQSVNSDWVSTTGNSETDIKKKPGTPKVTFQQSKFCNRIEWKNSEQHSNCKELTLIQFNMTDGKQNEPIILPRHRTKYIDKGIKSNKRYCYEIQATYEDETVKKSNRSTAIDIPQDLKQQPGNLRVHTADKKHIKIVWDKPKISWQVRHYKIERRLENDNRWIELGETKTTEYNDKSVDEDKKYVYYVSVFFTNKKTANATSLPFKAAITDEQRTPGDIEIKPLNNGCHLEWRGCADTNGLKGYRIERQDKSKRWVPLAEISKTCKYKDKSLEVDQEYVYCVKPIYENDEDKGMQKLSDPFYS